MYKKYYKRLFDILISTIALFFLSPLLMLIYFLVKIKFGTPVIFKQKRPGLNEEIFTLYKFRTMTNEKDKQGCLLPNNKRLTSFGKKLRETSLDELPELINILKGDMSFVGPRPLLVEYLPLYNKKQKMRHDVMPGLTGLAQINGRNTINWEKKFEWDFEYLKRISFFLDLYILLKTISKVFNKDGINYSPKTTMTKFQGSVD